MLRPMDVDTIFTDRKARRVRTTALFRTDGFARVEGCRRRSKRMAMDVARDIHKGGDAGLEEPRTTTAYKLQHQHNNEKMSATAWELRKMMDYRGLSRVKEKSPWTLRYTIDFGR
jgi:hypothetical protein